MYFRLVFNIKKLFLLIAATFLIFHWSTSIAQKKKCDEQSSRRIADSIMGNNWILYEAPVCDPKHRWFHYISKDEEQDTIIGIFRRSCRIVKTIQ
jgi:hypothetical protein